MAPSATRVFSSLLNDCLGTCTMLASIRLPTTCDVALFRQLLVDGFENVLARIGLDKAFLEYPYHSAANNLATDTKADETLQTESVEHFKLHLLVAQVEQLLGQQHAYH